MTAQPTVTFLNGATDKVFIGDTADLTLRFDNTASGANVGYAPYINVVLPTNGHDGSGAGNSPVNDGVSFISATYLGAPLESWTIEFNSSGQAVHPFLDDASGMPLVIAGTPGQTLLVLRLPFGSFTTDQTPADIDLKLGVSNLADVNSLLGVSATAGFAYGSDPFDNPCCDPPVVGSTVNLDINPIVAELTKTYIGPEQETATGPSYPREWVVQGDFAPGQPFTNVKLTDTMPDGTVVTGAHLEVNGLTIATAANIHVNSNGTTTVTGSFPGTITGGTQVPTLVIDFYVTEFLHDGTPVLGPTTGSFRQLDDNAKLDADWNPIDGRDANTHITIDPVGPENTITAKSIAVQKYVAMVSGDMDGNTVPDWQPHGVLEYVLDGQISNYFEANHLVMKDTLGDGQTFGAGFTPHVVIRQGGVTILDADLTAAEYTVAGKDSAGQTLIQFDISKVLADHGLSTALDGNGGSLGGASHATNYNQATVHITYHTSIDTKYTGPTPGDDYVDQGDPINNDVLYDGNVYTTQNPIEDDSHAGVTLPVSQVGKSIYAVNGDTAKGTTTFANPSLVQSGDLITYRLTLDLPLTSAHSVKLADYLPLPVLKVADSNADGSADTFHWDGLSGATPAAGHIAFGSTDTFHTNVPGVTPTLAIDSVSNSLTLNFGDVLNASYPTTHLDLLFTIAVTDAPFGDGLYLTNQVTSSETNSFNDVSQDNAIIQFLLGEPRLKITKGVIGSDNPTSALDSAVGPAGVSFSAPGSSGNRFTGTLNSNALDAQAVNANLSHADAGDTVSFAIILENKGQGWKGAFDTLVRDTLPAGFEIPAGGLNLHVTFGDGTSVPFHLVGSGLFDPAGGLMLDDASLIQGCMGTYNPTSAKNVVVITYDAHLVNSVQVPNAAIVNTATIVNYAAQEGGINRAPYDNLPDTDTASVSISPVIDKVVTATSLSATGTSQGSNSNADLAIGETVTYTITVTLPEGTSKSVWLDDLLPTGNGQIKAISATVTTVGANLHGNASLAVGQTATLSDTNADGVADKLHFDFGNVTNTTDNVTGDHKDQVVVTVVGVLTNAASNTAGDVLTNTATISAEDAANPANRLSYSDTADVDVVEPHLSLDKSVNVSTADAGDIVTYTITLANNQPGYNAPAFDVSIDDLLANLPPNAQFQHGTLAISAGSAAATIVTGNGATDTGIKVTAAQLDPGQHITLTFQAKVTDVAKVGADVPNTATSTASSLPGTDVNERTYTNSDDADFHIAAPTVTKVISATSYSDTGSSQYNAGNPDLKPGEVATYDITITLPEGDSPHLKVTDLLADILASGTASGQLQYVAGSAQVVSVGANLTVGSGPTITVSDSNANGTTDRLVVDFGTVHNQWDNVSNAKDQIVIRLQAKAVDVAANEPGDVLVNDVTVTTDNTSTSAHADADFVQPHLLVDKSTPFTSGDAGDVATYTITISHAADSHSNAYDVNLVDLLAPGLQMVAGSATTTAGTLSTAGGKVNLHLDQYNLGAGTITVTYQARLLDDVVNGQNITNTATLEYHSSSPVQDPTEGRELNGSDDATVHVALSDSVVKTITGTDNTYTTGTNVAFGETVTYSITATVGEGGQHLVVSDALPANLTYVSSKVLSIGASISGSSLAVGDAGTVSGSTISFDFGTIDNAGDNVVNVGDKVVVQVVAKVGAGASPADVLTNTATVSGTDGANPYGVNPNTPVPGGTSQQSVTVVAAAVGDKAFVDANGNGIQDSGEAGVGGVTVQLLDSTNAIVGTATTAPDGSYHFTNLVPGSYHEHFIAPAGWVITQPGQGTAATDSDPNPATGDGATFTLTNGQTDNTHDIGLYQPITIGDYAFVDANGDGLQTPGESPLPGVTVKLLDGANAVVATTTTNGSGAYSFTGLAPGQYHVQFVTPAGYTITPADQGGDLVDSDANVSTGITPTRTYVSGDVDNSIDAGFYIPASLGDRAWVDANGNGIQDGGEANLQGAVVRLFDAGNNLVGTATTDVNGAYSFTGLRPGTYHETFTAPSGYVITKAGAGTAATDNDSSGVGTASGSGPTINLVSGQNDITHDVGFYAPITIGDKVFNDADADGVQDIGETGISGATVKLLDGAGTVVATTTTDSNGLYHFTDLAPGDYKVQFVTPATYTASPADQGGNDTTDSDASGGLSPLHTYVSGDNDSTVDAGFYQAAAIGDRVWLDANGNGQQDIGENGISGVTVKLLDGSNAVLNTTTTDASGLYHFTGLVPGSYKVQFVTSGGLALTTKDSGADASDSDADTTSGVTGSYTLAGGQTDNTVDAGMYAPVSIGDRAFVDTNGNGLQDLGESGLANVTVKLLDGLGNVVSTTTTDSNGIYGFSGLKPATYQVQFVTPAGYTTTPADQGGDLVDSDANPTTGKAPAHTYVSGDADTSIDAGFYLPAALGDRAWVDANANGIQDSGEANLANVKVDLFDAANTLVGSVNTAADGSYAFTNLRPGTYHEVFTAPTGSTYVLTRTGAGTAGTDSDANGFTTATGAGPNISLASGQNDITHDAGFYQPVTIGDRVWTDTNGNGAQDLGETGIANVTVKLVDNLGNVVATQTTDGNGNYTFLNVVPGTYQVQFVPPAGYTFTTPDNAGDTVDSDANITTGLSPLKTYQTGDVDTSVDAGLWKPSSLGNFVFVDQNGNGVQDGADTPLGNIVVKLFDGAGHFITQTTTAPDGSYLFSNLAPGQYQEQFVKPAGYEFTQTGQGTAATDSDANPTTGYGQVITLTSGTNDLTHDAGLYQPVTIGDVAFEDMNGNGIQDVGDNGVAGVTVQLVNDTTNTVVATTTTAADGSYHFTQLPPGSYHEVFTNPSGYVFTPNGQGTPATDSDANPATGVAPGFSILSGQTDNTHDVGLYKPVSIGDYTWVDVNGNGQQDSGEPALAGVTVKLLDGANHLLATTTTDALGAYSFTGLAPGAYQVQFVAPSGYLVTPPDRGADVSDSDANVATGKAPVHTYVSGDHDGTIDSGFYKPATIGDYVFIDDNGNGVQDAGDTALGGVTVKLYDSTNTLVGTTTTAPDGSYHFSGLLPGDYHEQFVTPANYVLTQTGQGTAATDSDANPGTGFGPTITVISDQTDNTHDAGMYIPVKIGDYAFEDYNGNGIQDAGDQPLAGMTVKLYNNVTGALVATAITAPDGSYLFTVPPGSYFESFNAPLGFELTKSGQGTPATDSDSSGFQQTTGTGPVFVMHSGGTDLTHDVGAFRPVTIGDRVFEDQNGDGKQDAGDTNLAGVTVKLLDASNTVLTTTTTDSNGLYSFGNLPPGQYHVQVVPPAGFFFTTPDQGNDAQDSDANTGTGITPTKTYVSGDNDSTVDAGLWRPVTIGDRAWVDTDGDGQQDLGEVGLAGVTVTLVNEGTGATYTATTDAAGQYLFTGLPPGTYHEVFGKPVGYEFTLQNQGAPATDSDANQATGIGPSFAIKSGVTDLTHDAGLYIPGHVKGTAFEAMPPGICADKLPGAVFAGVTVNLVNAAGTVVGTTTTDAQGNYQIDGVAPGTYKVQFVSPTGLVLIPQHSGWLHDGSDAKPATGLTDSFVVLSGQTISEVDGGFNHVTGTIADAPVMSLPGGSYTFSTPVHVEFQGGANVNLNAAGSYIVGGNGGLTANANAGGSILIGGTGYSSLNGGPNGGSIMMGGQGGANIEGTSGNDIIIGGCGAISAQGLGANSAQGLGSGAGFLANLGGDLMIGGKGGDNLEFNHSNGTIYGGAGNDYLHAGANGVLMAGGTNDGTITYSAGQFSNLVVGDTVNGTGANTIIIYQAGDGVQKIENFNPASGDRIEVWGFAGPTAIGTVNGMGVIYFGPNQALVLNGWQPGNGPITGINYHAESSVAPGAIDHISPLVPVVLGSTVTTFYGAQGDDIVVGSDSATTFMGKGGNDFMVGGAAADVFYGNDGTGNTLKGNGGDDTFYGVTGSDSMDGGAGTDKVIYSFTHGSASWTHLANGDWEIIKPVGVDLLHDVEKVQFSDGVLTLATNSFVASLANDPDFNGDGKGDLLFHNDDGTLYQWQMNGTVVAAQGVSGWASTDWHIVGTADFNGDAGADILWQNTSGAYYLWQMNGTAHVGGGDIANPGGTWQINSIADFNGDHKADILWRNADGALYSWEMNGTSLLAGHDFGTISMDWQVRTTGDFNGDGKSDLLWQNSNTGDVYVWQMNGGAILAQGSVGNASGDWQIIGTGDFNADAKADILWQNTGTGELYEWQMNGFGITAQGSLGNPGSAWRVNEIEDLNGDRKADLVLTDNAGDVWAMMVEGLHVTSSASLGNAGSGWHLV